MPRQKTDALGELSKLMEEAHQLALALLLIQSRVAPQAKKLKKRKSAQGLTKPTGAKAKAKTR